MVLVPALPLAAALIVGLLGFPLLKTRSHIPVIAAIGTSFVLSLFLLRGVLNDTRQEESSGTVGVEKLVRLWRWAGIEGAYSQGEGEQAVSRPFDIDITLRADPLTAVMLSMVTFISSLVAIYAVGYMHGDPGYPRFFAYVSLFVFSMTMLVSVSNFVLLYVFWEAVGLCSYLLIGFWYEKPEAAAAGKKAFLVNRIGDFGFALGLFLLWTTYGTLNFHDVGPDGALPTASAEAEGEASGGKIAVQGVLGQSRLQDPAHSYVGGGVGLAICLCLLAGACGKSAQFPLHVWLPDAMEGPTPVSALIHAATMVTAGVYMFIRCTPLLHASPTAQAIVASVGAFTALLAGLIALTQNDLKRVMAYSTISQLGYMFLGVGTGMLAGIGAGMFHLFTHAFFKALLFLGSGSVMHAMGGIVDMQRFSGLRKIMPWTHGTFLVGCLALCGVFPFAGYFSKDAILAAAHGRAMHDLVLLEGTRWEFSLYQTLYYSGVFTALLTGLYTFRAFFMTFYGETRVPPEAGHHAHESPPSMVGPLVILAVFAFGIGYIMSGTEASHDQPFGGFLHHTPSLAFSGLPAGPHDEAAHAKVAALSSLFALSGIGLAAFLYLGERRQVERLSRLMKAVRLYQLSYGKFFFDQIYNGLIVAPLRLLASVCYWFDQKVIDGLVNLGGWLPQAFGAMLRPLQNGLLQFYALAMMLGLLVLIGALLMWPVS
jgi:NADH-quinone oxidoreductase subunit L